MSLREREKERKRERGKRAEESDRGEMGERERVLKTQEILYFQISFYSPGRQSTEINQPKANYPELPIFAGSCSITKSRHVCKSNAWNIFPSVLTGRTSFTCRNSRSRLSVPLSKLQSYVASTTFRDIRQSIRVKRRQVFK